ncbi:MAG: hypothetical protein J6Y69_02755 [Treponema sp.]|nr:hypothetical protein [Treponema sp.]
MNATSKIIFCTAVVLTGLSISSCKGKKAPDTIEADPVETEGELPAEETEAPAIPEAPDKILYTSIFGSTESPLATDFDGLEELGFGLYDAQTGIYHSCIEENGPFILELASLNELFRSNQLSPAAQDQNPMTFSYESKSLCEAAELVAKTLQTDSWEAIQATGTEAFKKAVKKLQINAKTYGIDELDAWYVKKAARIKAGK